MEGVFLWKNMWTHLHACSKFIAGHFLHFIFIALIDLRFAWHTEQVPLLHYKIICWIYNIIIIKYTFQFDAFFFRGFNSYFFWVDSLLCYRYGQCSPAHRVFSQQVIALHLTFLRFSCWELCAMVLRDWYLRFSNSRDVSWNPIRGKAKKKWTFSNWCKLKEYSIKMVYNWTIYPINFKGDVNIILTFLKIEDYQIKRRIIVFSTVFSTVGNKTFRTLHKHYLLIANPLILIIAQTIPFNGECAIDNFYREVIESRIVTCTKWIHTFCVSAKLHILVLNCVS